MKNNRPLSPHLQVYRLPLTGIISISHRITGVFLSTGLILFVGIVSIIASGPEPYAEMQLVANNIFFKLLYWGFIYALFFHLCHGVRHLIWDVGKSFDLETLDRYAKYELIASLVLTISTFVLI